jgi:hypothetical protein
MTTYYAVLIEESPRRIFNIVKLHLSTERFNDPHLIMWQDRCAECAEFQKRKLIFSGFPSGWKSLNSVINDMWDKGYRYDREYYYCRKFYREMVQGKSMPENVAVISGDRIPRLLVQLKPLIAEKSFRPHFYTIADPEWITNFTARHAGTYEADKNGIPEFKPAPMESQYGIVMFEGDISKKNCRASFFDLCEKIDTVNTTVIVIVPGFFDELDSAVEVVRAGAVAILRKRADLLNCLGRVIDYSATAFRQSRNDKQDSGLNKEKS